MATRVRSARKGRAHGASLRSESPRQTGFIVGGLVAAVVLIGVVGITLLWTSSGNGQAAAPVAASEDASRPAAPNFTVPTLDGSKFSLDQQQGKVTVMYFKAGWCTTCYPEAQALARIYPQYHDRGLQVVAMDVQLGEGPQELDAFRKHAGNGTYVWAYDQNLKVAQAYGVNALEHTVVIDRQGRIAFHDKVSNSQQKLEQEITSLL